jgi:hypothetical protein
MAKKRTRQQKEKTQKQRGQVKAPAASFGLEEQLKSPRIQLQPIPSKQNSESVVAKKKLPSATTSTVTHSLLRVDQKYLRSDLRRSVIVSLILLAVLIGISWALRYNGLTMLKGIGN